MKRELLAATALTSFAFGYSTQARAQTYDWTGFYVGGVAGYGSLGPNPATFQAVGSGYGLNFRSGIPVFARGLPLAPRLPGPFAPLSTNSLGAGTFTGGAVVGYNRQFGHYVIGIETDFSSLSTRASGGFSQTDIFANGRRNTSFLVSVGTDWLYTLRGRLGYAQDRWLVFATGGLAAGQTHLASNFGINERGLAASFTPIGIPGAAPGKGTFVSSRYSAGANGFGSRDDVRIGYVLGGGVEYALTNHLTLKLEGLYYDLGVGNLLVAGGGQYRTNTTTTVVPFFGQPTTNNASSSGRFAAQPYLIRYRFDGAIIRIGANYKF